MFRYIKLKNYKSLIDFKVDLTLKKNTPQQFTVIYGENGIGKSNFVCSFYTLFKSIMTRAAKVNFDRLIADANNKMDSDDIKAFKKFIMGKGTDIESLIRTFKTNGSEENMVLEFGFQLNGKNGIYIIETDNNKIVSEKLEYIYNKNKVDFFSLSEESKFLNDKIFTNTKYKEEIEDLLEKFWGKHSLLSLIVYEEDDKNSKYVREQLSKEIMSVLDFFRSISVRLQESPTMRGGRLAIRHDFFTELQNGIIPKAKLEKLEKAENFLNDFFTSIYSDIKKVYYKKEPKNKSLKYELRLKKQMYGELIDVSFTQESTGTQNILDLVPFLISAIEGRTVIFDEIDTGIHDLLMCYLTEKLEGAIRGQVIITTHNTILLESNIDKKGIYIFTSDHGNTKRLVPLSDFEGRVHPNINIRKRYFEGLYGGIPTPTDIDMTELVSDL